MEVVVISPRDEGFLGIREPGLGFLEPLTVLLLIASSLNRAGGKIPVLDGDDLRLHCKCGEEGMVVLGDKPGDDDVVLEGPVDAERLIASGSLQLVKAPSGEDAVSHDGHRLNPRRRRVEGYHFPGFIDDDLWELLGGFGEILKGVSLCPE